MIAKPAPPYSVLNPDTSSDSPSEKSKGVRLHSAIQEISHKKKIKKRGTTNDTFPKTFNTQEKYKPPEIANKLNIIIERLIS